MPLNNYFLISEFVLSFTLLVLSYAVITYIQKKLLYTNVRICTWFSILELSYEIGTFRFHHLFSVFHYCYLVMKLSDSDYTDFYLVMLGYYAIIIFMIPEFVLFITVTLL